MEPVDSFTGNKGQSFWNTNQGRLSELCHFGKGDSPAVRTADWCVPSVLGWRADGLFCSMPGGTPHVWFPSQTGRTAVIQPGGYKCVDCWDQFCVQCYGFCPTDLRDFLRLLLFTASVVLKSPEGP